MDQNLETVRRFILGGQAIFTVRSKKSGERKTFRVRATENADRKWFVDVLIGADNTSDYRYIGFLWEIPTGLQVKINPARWGSEAFTVFRWLITMINYSPSDYSQRKFESDCEFLHSGHCSVCGRLLTEPESIERGIGPVCRGR